MVVIAILLLFSVPIMYMESSESHSRKESSEVSLKTDIFISQTSKNADWYNYPLRLTVMFDYNGTQKSKCTQIIQFYSFKRRMELKQFNIHYIYDHNKGKALKYVATKAGWNSNNTSLSDHINNTNNNYDNISNNSIMKDIVNDNGDDLVHNKHKKLFAEPDINSTRFECNDIYRCKIINMYDNSQVFIILIKFMNDMYHYD